MIRFKKIFVATILSVLSANSANAGELEDKCAEIYMYNEPEVTITYNYGQLKYDNSKTDEELKALYSQVNPGSSVKNIQGLTYLEPSVTTGVSDIKLEMVDNEHFCFYPAKIDIKIRYNPTVYVINTLPPKTCRFNVTVRHEQTHLDLGHHALFLFAKSLREAVPDILSSTEPIVESVSSANSTKVLQDMTNAYHEKVKTHFEVFKNNLVKYNNLIDTSDNYIDETKLCQSN